MDIPELTLVTYIALMGAGFLAGLIDSVAGGGGLIALPALLFAGLPPQLALGTNKLQGSFGTLAAAWNYIRNGQASLTSGWTGIAFTFTGAAAGAVIVQSLDPGIIRPLIPLLLFAVFIYTLISKNLGSVDCKARMGSTAFYITSGLCLGFYDGFFGPGTGSFWTIAFILLLGFNMTKATGYTKIMNFTSNIVALAMFAAGGNVSYQVGLTMAVGQILGARVGSGLAIKKGVKFIRPIFMSVVFLTIVRLVYQDLR